MGSPITFSGFNNIDFNSILEALSAQERVPVRALEDQQLALQQQRTAFGTLATRLSVVEAAARDLASMTAFSGLKAAVSNESIARAAVGSGGSTGTYSVVVNQLARAQVTVTTGATPDGDSTIVASGGTLTIGDATVTVSGDVTLRGLAQTINDTPDVGVTATVVRSGDAYQLVLTGKDTGAAGAFTVGNALTGGAGIGFSLANAQDAQDASVTINNVPVTSATNTIEGAIAGTTLTLQQESSTPITITITADTASVEEMVRKFASSYNELLAFLDEQTRAYAGGQRDNIGGDPLVRQLRSNLSRAVSGTVGTGDTYTSLAQVGLSFTRTGRLEFSDTAFAQALATDRTAVLALFQGAQGTDGAFAAVRSSLSAYTASGGLIPSAQTRLDDQMSKLGARIEDFEQRLAIRKEALQKEFIAADLAIAQLNASRSQLGSFGASIGSF